ncbi:MAG: AAA family ATPase [Roseomonas sp.]|nr:AAA family ATPase [Roseomonas sp.]MCA3307056.1 AAA family ATPase [Roseomonas sp.]
MTNPSPLRRFADAFGAALAAQRAAAPPELAHLANDDSARRRWILEQLGWNSNDQQYWQPARFQLFTPAKAQALHKGVGQHFPGANLPPPAWDMNAADATAQAAAWLTRFVKALGHTLERQGREAQCLPHPRWRAVPRPQAERLRGLLAEGPAAAVVGMSGSGKSFLAQQVFDAWSQGPKLWLDAPKPREGRLAEGEMLTIAAALARYLAQHIPRSVASEDPAWIALLRDAQSLAIGAADDRGGDLARQSEVLRNALKDANAEKTLRMALADLAGRMIRPDPLIALIRHLACLLPPARTKDAARLLIVLDDVWIPIQLRALVKALTPPPERSADTWPLRLLLTSQDRLVLSAGREDASAMAATVEFERDESDPPAFAWRVLAAWACPGKEAVSPEEAASRIGNFARDVLDNANERACMAKVLSAIGWHPLTTAAIGSVWRELGHTAALWRDLERALGTAIPEALRRLPEAERADAAEMGLNERHAEILTALLLVTETALDEGARERFRDLAIHRPGAGALPIELFAHLWRCAPRAGRTLSLADGQNPIVGRFTALMLVQQRGEGTFLHDMLRRAIEADLQRRGQSLAERHRDLLVAVGLASEEGVLLLDERKDFRLTDPVPGRVASERCRLHLRLDRDVDEETRERLSRYILDEAAHHAVGAASWPQFGDLTTDLLTFLPFLQAQLDMED